MASETNPDTFGSYLRHFRREQRLTIETVAVRTKISANCLRAMERGEHDRLPPRAYVKSFIRTYAGAVGADADVALSLYAAELERQASIVQQRLRREAKLAAFRRILLTVGLVSSVLLLVQYTAVLLDPAPPPRDAGNARYPQPATEGTGTPSTADPLPGQPATEKLKLHVVAVKETWLKVIVDSQKARAYELKPEDRLELEGTRRFNLMIGDATGLKIYLNDRPVTIYGSNGQVVSLTIP